MVMSTEDNADVDVMRIYGDDFYTDTFLSPVYLRLIHDSATPEERGWGGGRVEAPVHP